MNELMIPPAAHWYRNGVMACASDNTLVYGSKKDLVVIEEGEPDKTSKVSVLHGHSTYVIAVSVNKRWGEPHKHCVSSTEYGVIFIWDLQKYVLKHSLDLQPENGDSIGTVFAGEDRVVSVTTTGIVTIWNFTSNDKIVFKHLFGPKTSITCLSACPHASWLVAFGLQNGLVIVTDLRRNGKVLFKLRGHEKSVISLSWCPAPINIFPKNPNNRIKRTTQSDNLSTAEKIIDQSIINCDQTLSAEAVESKALDFDNSHSEQAEINESKSIDLEKNIDDSVESNELHNIVDLQSSSSEKDTDDQNYFDEATSELPKFNCEKDPKCSPEIFVSKYCKCEQVAENTCKCLYNLPKNISESGVQTESNSSEVIKNNTKTNPWINLRYADDDDECAIGPEVQTPKIQFNDFFADCMNLRSRILGTSDNRYEIEINTDGEEKQDSPEKLKKSPSPTRDLNREFNTNLELSSSNHNRPFPVIFDGDFLDDKDENDESLNLIIDKSELENVKENITSTFDENQQVDDVELNNGENFGIKAVVEDTETKKEEILITPTPKIIVEFEEEPRAEYLLASSGADRYIYIWRAGSDGHLQTFFFVPKKKINGKNRNSSHPWIVNWWISPNIILTNSVMHEVLAWTLPKPKEGKAFKIVCNKQENTIHNIVTPFKLLTKDNWDESYNLQFWLNISNLLINQDMTTKQIKVSYSTVSSAVTCMASSPVDPNRLAIGLKEGYIKIWDLSLPHVKSIGFINIKKKLNSKITTLCWSSSHETYLAYGTEEGQVGFFDTQNQKHVNLYNYFRNTIHHIEWGPTKNIFAVAEGKISIYDITKPDKIPKEIEVPENKSIYRFAWKPDGSLLLISLRDGSLLALDEEFKIINTVYLTERGFNDIVWHLDAVDNDLSRSPRLNWFAAATTKGFLVYDCSLLRTNNDNTNLMDNIIVNLEGHLKPVTSLVWSPFNTAHIASSAPDGMINIWNVDSKTIIATIVDNISLQHPTSILWSSLDPDLLIVAERNIAVVKISKNPPRTNDEFLLERKKKLKPDMNSKGIESNKIKLDLPKVKIIQKNSIIPMFYTSSSDNIEAQILNMQKLMKQVENEDKEVIEDTNNALQLFGGQEDIFNLLTTNYNIFKKESKHSHCNLISLWKGDICSSIKEAIEENRVTPAIIAIAPMASPKLWQQACEVYAKKLSESADGDPLETAMYYLACHKIEDALNSLCAGFMFREALVLAKCRLPDNNEIVMKITEKWAHWAIENGNFEAAAYCYISIGNWEEAAKILGRRNNVKFLQFACDLASKSNNKELHDLLKFKLDGLQQSDEKVLLTRIETILEKNLNAVEDALENIQLNESEDSNDNQLIENLAQDEKTNELLLDNLKISESPNIDTEYITLQNTEVNLSIVESEIE